MKKWLIGVNVEEGLEILLKKVHQLEMQLVPIGQVFGRILAKDIVAREDIPPFSRSPYDGYALKAEDTKDADKNSPVTLKIIEEVSAGHVAKNTVGNGEAIKILTGAPIPNGADIVVKYEDTSFNIEEVCIFQGYESGMNIVPKGEDVSCGDTVVKKGIRLTPALTGLLAGLGYDKVMVYRRPIVAILSTGDELVDINCELAPGKIRNSSMYMLKAYLESYGMEVVLLGIVPDQVEVIGNRIKEGIRQADLVMTTGGVSVGDYDLLPKVMSFLNAEVLFWKTKMKPGSAFLAASYGEKMIISLSGNPTAAAVAMLTFAIPVLRKMSGEQKYLFDKIKVKICQSFNKSSPNRRMIPGRLVIKEGQAYLDISKKNGNGMIRPLHGCDYIAEIPAGSPPLEEGSSIMAYCIS